jgi:hypothetical protein
MTLTDAEAEAMRIYYHLYETANVPKAAKLFGCCHETVYNTINNKFHNGRGRGDTITPRGLPTPTGEANRKKLLGLLRAGPKEFGEIHKVLGVNPTKYLTEMKKAGKIAYKTVWVLK